jgi:hypothetical protein
VVVVRLVGQLIPDKQFLVQFLLLLSLREVLLRLFNLLAEVAEVAVLHH